MAGFGGAMNFMSPMSGLLGLSGGGGGFSQTLGNFMGNAAPNIASFYNTGSQKLSAPALSTLLGSMYQPQQGTPYAPGPDYYEDLLDIMRQQNAGAASGMEGFEGLLAAMMGQQQGQQTPPAQPPAYDFGNPTLNNFMYNMGGGKLQVGSNMPNLPSVASQAPATSSGFNPLANSFPPSIFSI